MNPHIVLFNALKALWSKAIQNRYDMEDLRMTRNIVVFLVPPGASITGGVMSIYSLCSYSREACPDSLCLISTLPGFFTHAANRNFQNSEKVHRWKQVVKNAKQARKMILHIPESYVGIFRAALDKEDLSFLKAVPDLQINLLNQNIEMMPDPVALKGLYDLTGNITQTAAHHRYATQEVCDRWRMPTHLFSVHIEMGQYAPLPFNQKSKTLVVSPDANADKERILARLREELSDYRLVVVQGLTFDQYMCLVASSRFSVTFGEGFDGYFADPFRVGGVGFGVYNTEFFPDRSWLELRSVYASYQEMFERIVADIRFLEQNPHDYEDLSALALGKLKGLYSLEEYRDNLRRFYAGRYDFVPACAAQDLPARSLRALPAPGASPSSAQT